MRAQFLNEPTDIDWLFDVHLRDFPLWQTRTKSFVLRGNEDCPQSVELYESPEPTVNDRPFINHTFYTV
jgi:hypothetical protein